MSLLLSVFARLLLEQTDHQIAKKHPAGVCLPVRESAHGCMDVCMQYMLHVIGNLLLLSQQTEPELKQVFEFFEFFQLKI